MKSRMSRRLALLNVTFSSGARRGSGAAAPAARACSRSFSIAGFGRDASMRSRIARSSSAAFAPPAGSTRPSRPPCGTRAAPCRAGPSLRSRGPRDVLARRVLHRTFELDLVLRLVGALLDRARVVRHRRVPVARRAPLPGRGGTPGRRRTRTRTIASTIENHKPLFTALRLLPRVVSAADSPHGEGSDVPCRQHTRSSATRCRS